MTFLLKFEAKKKTIDKVSQATQLENAKVLGDALYSCRVRRSFRKRCGDVFRSPQQGNGIQQRNLKRFLRKAPMNGSR